MEIHRQTGAKPASNISMPASQTTTPQAGGIIRSTAWSQDAYEQWIRRFAAFMEQIAGQDRSIHSRVKPILDAVREPHVTVTFGGHFNSGKSTIINAALGHALLPVDDLPETGALCILRTGDRDAAVVTSGQRHWLIQCTTPAIQHAVSLISQSGDRRMEAQKVDRLELTLKNAPIPALASWIDSPGINDSIEMNERALQAARLGDILLWVLSSRQPLSTEEMAFIAQYVAERGPGSVMFLLNVFLKQDTKQEWELFLSNKLHVYRNKVNDHALFMGFTLQSMPVMLAVSARSMNKQSTGFGGPEVRHFLLSFVSAEHSSIRKVRLQRATIMLRKLADDVKPKVEKERMALATAQMEVQQKQKEADRKSTSFKRAIENAVNDFFNGWSGRVRSSAVTISAGITAQSIRYDDGYTRLLNEQIQATTGAYRTSLLQQIASAASLHGQLPLRDTGAFTNLLTPPPASVIVPEQKGTGGGAAIGATAGATVGTFVAPVIGTAIGALAGAFFGALAGSSSGDAKAAPEAKANVLNACESVIRTFEAKKQGVINYIVANCVAKGAPGKQPDNTALQRMEGILQSLSQLAQEATSLEQRA